MTLRLTRLNALVPIVDSEGRPTPQFMMLWQKNCESIETAVNAIQGTLDAIQAANDAADAAQAAADSANAAAEAITAESSLSTSYVINFTVPLVSADSSGNVTIADHDRKYGNGDVVSVDGDVIATGLANPDIARIFYSDPSRDGGAVVYQFSEDEADAAQVGDIHSVGAVEIPAAGTASGGYVRPPGYSTAEP
jgi:hypothetical protein